jgi:hypothetical protein
MSHCRTLNRISRKEQQLKPQNPGIIRVNQLSHDIIARDPEKIVNLLVYLFIDGQDLRAGEMLFKFASGAILEVHKEEPTRRPSLINQWVVECEQQDREQQKEAEAAQEAAARELGQFPEPETAVPTAAIEVHVSQPKPDATQSMSSNANNMHVNEIGLPIRGQSQTMNEPGSGSCRSTVRQEPPGHESNQAVLNQAELDQTVFNQSGASIYA